LKPELLIFGRKNGSNTAGVESENTFTGANKERRGSEVEKDLKPTVTLGGG